MFESPEEIFGGERKDKKTSRHVHWGAYMDWMEECRDRVEKTPLLNLKGQLDQVTMQMPVRLEKKIIINSELPL